MRINGASLKEQVAGLLHDTSHTAFSHVIDWVFGDPSKADFQDKLHEDKIKNSEIKNILEKHSFSPEEISNYSNFSLLEKKAPSLCADRIDYTLRETATRINLEKARFCFRELINFNNSFAFKSEEAAKLFADLYAQCQKENWSGNESKARYHILADILKIALNKKIIYFQDFKRDDNFVVNLLKNSKDEDILNGLNLLKKGFLIKETDSDKKIELRSKFRYIDPEILLANKIVRLSDISEEYKIFIDKEKQDFKPIVKVNILNRN